MRFLSWPHYRTIRPMNEFELIQRCFADWPVHNPNVLQGIGDDCLVWRDPEPLVISTDTAVSGRHFPVFASPEQVAQRAFLPAISDLAAMTARPEFFTLALTLPNANTALDEQWVTRFAARLRSLAERFNIALAGGDTTSGEQLTVTISVHGSCAHPVMRSGAQAGDDVWLTGNLGQAAAALPYVLAQNESQCPEPQWLQAYWQPEPPVAFASQLQGCIHSAIDLSDGLLGDAAHIAQRSNVELALQVDHLPMDAQLYALGQNGLKYALTGGDDYQLLFTASPVASEEILAQADEFGIEVSHIGRVNAGKAGVRWYDGAKEMPLDWHSFTHF